MMTPRTHRRLIVASFLYVIALLSLPSPARAEDIDIFSINPNIASMRPNVLIILDNTANWSSTDTDANDGSKRFENVRSALANTVAGLTDQFNVGLMTYTETGSGWPGQEGGYLRAGVRQLTTTNKAAFAGMVGHLNDLDKGNNSTMGLAFYEAYLYFSGGTAFAGSNKLKRDFGGNALPTSGNQSGNNPDLAYSNRAWSLPGNALTNSGSTNYTSPMSDACQKNFIIYISNGVTQENSQTINLATTKLASVGGDTTPITLAAPDGLQSNVADEWARFLANSDVRPDASNPGFPGKQSVVTYTVEVGPITAGQGPDFTQLMKSIATQGKGKYFGVHSGNGGSQIADALNKIFAEVMAVNSVFASSTLPVSVNVRGTFLNQVYMGVFRPDGNSSPRWPGNVKQYTLAATPSGGLALVDKVGQPVENASTGFVAPSTQSFWTVGSGFWDNIYYPDTVAQPPLPATTSDLPDGEFVEKGGAAEHLRNSFASNVTTRNTYTCITAAGCGSGTILSGSANHSFDAANGYITDSMLGIGGPQAVSSLSRSGTTATAVVAGHGFTTGQVVGILGANEPQYNGTYTISVVNANTFTYQITESPVSPATTATSITAAQGAASFPITSMTRSGTTVTVAAPGHTFTTTAPNNSVIISGADQAAYNGSKTVTSFVAGVNFTFTVTETPVSPATAAGTATVGATSKNIKTNPSIGVTRSGTTVTIETTNNHGFSAGSSVMITGVTPAEYNGTFSITSVPTARTFTYNLPASSVGPASPATGALLTASTGTFRTLTSLTRSGTTATATTSVPHGFAFPGRATISGASQPEYNGTYTILSVPSTTTFTYAVSVSPPSSATGSITATGSGGLNRASLINWVRGANEQLDDNPNVTPTASATRVRGYLHGDVLHSRPAVVNYNRTGQPVDRDVVIYYGANDGMIHAVKGGQDDADGNEKWGFIPTEFYKGFARLYNENPIISSTNSRTYFADGPLSVDAVYVNDRIEGAGARAQLFAGMRRGGRLYYSLDVTNPDAPVYKWKIDSTVGGFNELGQSWSEPKVAKINVAYPPSTPPAARTVLIFGAGYDAAANDPATQGAATMGRGIFVVDAATGGLIWHGHSSLASPGAAVNAVFKRVSGMDYAIPADLAVINSDRDVTNYADRIYAADTGGNIWRVNIADPDPANWTVGQVASLGGTGANARKFLFAPDVVPFDSATDSILVGSGDREQPFDTTIANRFYMIKDAHAIDAQPASPATENELCDLTANNLQGTDLAAASVDETCLATSKGWMVRLDTGEKVVTGATTLSNTTIFATNTPASQATPGQCTGSLGKALIYAVNFKNATAQIDFTASGVLSARAAVRPGGGFPPTPVPVSIKIGAKYYEGAITGTQVVNPPGAAIGQRYRVFWNLNVDN